MLIARSLREIRTDGRTVRLLTDGPEIRLLLISEHILRIRAGLEPGFREESYSLVATAWEDRLDSVLGSERTRVEPLPLTITHEDPDRAVLRGGALTIDVARDPFALTVTDDSGHIVHQDVPGIAWQRDANGRAVHHSRASERDAFYGMGETTGPLNKARTSLTLSPKDALGWDPERADPLYKHIPIGIRLDRTTRRAAGFFLHTTWAVEADFSREHSNYWPRRIRLRADGGDLDLFVIAGPAIRDVIRRATWLTGRSAMLPRQALGYLASSMYYAELPREGDRGILEMIDTAREEGIPVDGFQLSSGYTTQHTSAGDKRCVLTWNRDRFPDPAGFFAAMRERGVLVSPNVKPGILDVHPRYAEFADADVLVRTADGTGTEQGAWWGGPGRFIDFTSPRARVAWATWLRESLLDHGAQSIWNDNCEYDSLIDQDARVDFDGTGATIGRLRTVMANLMCMTTHQAIREADPDLRPYVVCRAGHVGIQRYAQTWAGDNTTSWASLQHNIATILGMGLSGVAHHGCDIGGFHGPRPGPELLLRWVQHGIFQPRFSIHSVNADSTVTEPWMHPSVAPLIRDAIRLRYRMGPYLYSLMRRAHTDGLPLMEPLVSAFQHDPALDETSSEFMLGNSLLVATVLQEGARERTLRLPAGRRFHELATGAIYEGGREITLEVGLESIPLFMPEGGILPLADGQPMSFTGPQPEGLRLLIAPGRDADFTLYEDDGVTRAYERGDLRETRIALRHGAPGGTDEGRLTRIDLTRRGPYRSPITRLRLEVLSPDAAPMWVEVDGERLPQILHGPRFEQADRAWRYDPELGRALVRLPDDGDDHRIVLCFDPFDMIGM